MLSVVDRRKTIVSSAGIQVDTLLNKSAAQSTSLFQQCSSLRSRLLRIRGFPYYFSLASPLDSRQSTDPVTQLWDLFSLGVPLCYIFDQLPNEGGFNKINNSYFNLKRFEANPDRVKKHAIAVFVMQIHHPKVQQTIPGCEPFTVTDLWDRNSTDGLVKVINTVTAIVNYLPPNAFDQPTVSLPSLIFQYPAHFFASDATSPVAPTNTQDTIRNHVIRDIVETERKYVQDLEVMQKYSSALSQSNLIDQDTIHLLFPNLKKLLNFQRKFLIRLESTAELPWQAQRWGQHFLENETDFIVYEPYCANYILATELMLANEQNLVAFNHLINVKGELPAFLIKPIQRVCNYPPLLDSLIDAASVADYPHYDELKRGSAAAKRITDKISEAQRRAENDQTIKGLERRVDDWKGHHLKTFGELLLNDMFIVTQMDIDREYYVFLFETVILCFKDTLADSNKKVNKGNSIFKKQSTLSRGVGQLQKKNSPLLLMGRIAFGNITQAVPVIPRNSTVASSSQYPLTVWFKGDDDSLEFFTIRCRREDQMRQWETQINHLIKEAEIRNQFSSTKLHNPSFCNVDLDLQSPLPSPEQQSHNLLPFHSLPPQPKIYMNLFSYVAQVLQKRSWETDLIVSFQEHSEHMAELDSLSSLVCSHKCCLQLLQISMKLKIASEPSFRKVLQKDEVEIIKILQRILCSDVERKAVLSLQEDDALDFANLLQSTLDRGSLGVLHHDAQRLLVKLSILPSDLAVKGVTLTDNNVIFGGGFADIYQASYQGREVALKRMRVFQRGQEFHKIKQRFCHEALLWQQLDHPNVLPFLGIEAEIFSPHFCIVTPWMQHGTILQHVSDYGGINIDEQILQVAQALEYLHSQKVVHGDLRGGNILIDDNWDVRLADFGLAGFVDATVHTSTAQCGSIRWMAPELHDPELFNLPSFQRTFASDIYAFACVCVEIYTGHVPFFDVRSETTVILQVTKGQRPTQPLGNHGQPISDALWSIIQHCWTHDPSDRPSSSDVVDLLKGSIWHVIGC